MKNKKLTVSIVCVLLLGVVIFSSFRIYNLNNKYPNPKIVEYPIGQSISGGGIDIVVEGSELIDGERLKEIVPDYIYGVKNTDGSELGNDQVRILLVNLKITNTTDEPQNMTVCQIYAESLTCANGIDAELYEELNVDKGNPIRIELDPNEEMEVVLPYSFCSRQFKSKDWNNIDNRVFDLSLATYPIKYIALLS